MIPKRIHNCWFVGFLKDIKLGWDFLLWIRIALKYKVAFLNKSLSFYNQDVYAANRGIGMWRKPQVKTRFKILVH